MPGTFSKRTSWNLDESALAVAIREARQVGQPLIGQPLIGQPLIDLPLIDLPLIDLTVSNPTRCGFQANADDSLLAPLRDPAALTYDPDPRGLAAARQAVSAYYREHDAQVDAGDVVLTTSTSEAYSFLFRLLCDPGDEVLVAQPSYPLFDFLATLDDVTLAPYPLFYDFGWSIDFAELERRITPRTRAVLLVHPNNPTGHATSATERRELERICTKHGLALIVDEVFLDFSLGEPIRSFATGEHPCLTFVVSGISKIAALPQMKVGWLAAFGPERAMREALGRLEVVADTFLSMNAPVQLALPHWLAGRGAIEREILGRVRANLLHVARCIHLSALPVEAGWSAVLELPQRLGCDDLAEHLVRECGLIVHPAAFYAMAGKHRIVVSLIGPEGDFAAGLGRLDAWCAAAMLFEISG